MTVKITKEQGLMSPVWNSKRKLEAEKSCMIFIVIFVKCLNFLSMAAGTQIRHRRYLLWRFHSQHAFAHAIKVSTEHDYFWLQPGLLFLLSTQFLISCSKTCLILHPVRLIPLWHPFRAGQWVSFQHWCWLKLTMLSNKRRKGASIAMELVCVCFICKRALMTINLWKAKCKGLMFRFLSLLDLTKSYPFPKIFPTYCLLLLFFPLSLEVEKHFWLCMNRVLGLC